MVIFDKSPRSCGKRIVLSARLLNDKTGYIFRHVTGPALINADRDDFNRVVILTVQDAIHHLSFGRDRLRLDVRETQFAEVAEYKWTGSRVGARLGLRIRNTPQNCGFKPPRADSFP